METETAGELPNSFNGIEFWRVRGQIVEREVKGVFFSPGFVETGMMIFGIIGDHHHPTTSSDAAAAKDSDEREEGEAVEFAHLAAEEKLPVAKPHRGKVSHAVPRGCMQQDGILGFRWDPHLASRAMLLEVHLVHSPEIHLRINA